MKIKYTVFGSARLVDAEPYNMKEYEAYDCTLWVEREEDYYALMSPQYKGKKVAIVTRADWFWAEPVEEE